MATKVGVISSIRKPISPNNVSLEKSLSDNGFTRMPGTGVLKFPFKELSGRYRTGLDPNASYISRISDTVAREAERDYVTKLRKEICEELNLDEDWLSPSSDFWNSSKSGLDGVGEDGKMHIQGFKLVDGDNFFDFGIPLMKLAFAWLRVHPTIAPSFQAWENGDVDQSVSFYVKDSEIENTIIFNKKKLINKAISKFDGMSLEDRKRVARLMGLSVSDSTSETEVYNIIDNVLKQGEFQKGSFRNRSTVEVFNTFADLDKDILVVKDMIKQALQHSIYKLKTDKVFEGDQKIADSEEELAKFLLDDENQTDRLALQKKLQAKKIASI